MNWLKRHNAHIKRVAGVLGLTLAGWLAGTPMSAQAASFAIEMHILNPPNAVTGLSASPVGSQTGDVQLVWTAPSNDNRIAIQNYLVRFATYPANGTGVAAESWWATQAPSQRTLSPAHAPGVTEFGTVTGLTVGTTFYFGMKAVDLDLQISPVDIRTGTAQQAKSMPLNLGGGAPPTPAGFTGVAISSTIVEWQWSAAATATFYTLNASPSGSLVLQTSSLLADDGGHTPNKAITRTLKAGNSSGLSPATAARTVYTFAAVPSTPTTAGLGNTHVDLVWNANANPAGTQYRVERSLDNSSFSTLTLRATPSYSDTTVTEGTSYYYRVSAINGDGIPTLVSGVLLAIPSQTDFLAPAEPLGLKGVTDSSKQFFTLTWEATALNDDGTHASDILGYHVYRRSLLNGTAVRVTTTPITITAFADQINSQVYYYTVRTVDTSGNLSVESLLADSSPENNVIFVGSDGETSVTLPSTVNGLLRSGSNDLGVPLTIDLQELPFSGDPHQIRAVNLRLLRGDTRQPVQFMKFNLPNAHIAISYAVQNGEIVRGSPLSVRSAAIVSNATPDQLSLFWNNGASLIKVGGKVNTASHTLSLNTSVLGEYQLRISVAATSLNLDRANVFPRLITPNGDGLNDRIFFVLENPNNSIVSGEILDKDGRLVARLADPSLSNGVGTTLNWDGRDSNGAVVPGGVYIYKIQGEGHSFTGTVGVAR